MRPLHVSAKPPDLTWEQWSDLAMGQMELVRWAFTDLRWSMLDAATAPANVARALLRAMRRGQ